MAHLYIFPGIELYFAAAISILLFIRWKRTKDTSTYYWMLAFLFYSLYDIIQIIFVSNIIVFRASSYFLMHFFRQTLISLMFISVYYGIIRLLTKDKFLTKILPITFFTLQEILIAYGDFFVKNIEIADKLHVIFFDVPFNLIIALLFLKLYQVNKKRYSLLISLAWLGYAILVPIYFYVQGNLFTYIISLLPMLIMFLAFLIYYKAPTGEELMEVQPAIEKRLKTKKKYRLKPGHSYLVEERSSDIAFDIFVDAVMHGIRGLCITRTKPDWIKEKYGLKHTPVLWLTQLEGKSGETVDPTELEQFLDLIDKFVQKAKSEEEGGKESVKDSVKDSVKETKEESFEKSSKEKVDKIIDKEKSGEPTGIEKYGITPEELEKEEEENKPEKSEQESEDLSKEESEQESKDESEEQSKDESGKKEKSTGFEKENKHKSKTSILHKTKHLIKKKHQEIKEKLTKKKTGKSKGKMIIIGDDNDDGNDKVNKSKDQNSKPPKNKKSKIHHKIKEKITNLIKKKSKPKGRLLIIGDDENSKPDKQKHEKEENSDKKEHTNNSKEDNSGKKEHTNNSKEDKSDKKVVKENSDNINIKESDNNIKNSEIRKHKKSKLKSIQQKLTDVKPKKLHHKIKTKISSLIKHKSHKKEISQEDINRLLKEKGKHLEEPKTKETVKEDKSSDSKPEKILDNKRSIVREDNKSNKPKYIKHKKKKGKLIFVGASKELKKRLNHKAYLVLKTKQINHRKSIILIDGLEYLITNNSFSAVKNIITLLKDKISEGDSALVVPIDPKTLTKQQITQLEQEFYLFDPKRKNYLN